jgi:Na+-translocating ferredoxin:NAD+ oxidoreductase RnfD subunit
MTYVDQLTPSARQLARLARTPKVLLILELCGLLAVALLTLDQGAMLENVIIAATVAAVVDVALTYARTRRWLLPDGAILTGMIVAFVLAQHEGHVVLAAATVIAIASKHLLRTRWSNIANPAALALVVSGLLLHTSQSWWGALPDSGIAGILILLVAGGFIADRVNKLPMIFAFFVAYFGLLTVASWWHAPTVAETFRTPDLQASLFFAFFMLDDPPTSPVRYEDQVMFGAIVGTAAYYVLMMWGVVYFLPAGLLAGNAWESGRRWFVARRRERPRTGAQQAPPLRRAVEGVPQR